MHPAAVVSGTDTKFTVLSRLTSSCVKDTPNLVHDKGHPINVVMNEGPGLIFKEVPPDFDVMLLTIIKKVTRYRSFYSKEMLHCCKLWMVSIFKLWIILQSSASLECMSASMLYLYCKHLCMSYYFKYVSTFCKFSLKVLCCKC